MAGYHAGDCRAWDIYAIVFVGGNSTVSFGFTGSASVSEFYLSWGCSLGILCFPCTCTMTSRR